MKRFWKLLGVALFCAALLPVLAFAETPAETAETAETFKKDFSDSADILHALGLFQGSSKGYELDRAPTRAEASVMLVRLLGKEDAALSASAKHPFQDVPGWANPYVAYMYANGLTKGVSATRFGTGLCDANMYATFLLRALGYDDEENAVSFNDNLLSLGGALARARAIDLLSDEHLLRLYTEDFLRGDLAVLSLGALFTETKGEEAYLIDRLVSEKAVEEATAKRYKDILKAADLKTRGFFLSAEENGYESLLVETYSLSETGYAPARTDKYISEAKGVLDGTGWREIFKVTELLQDEERSYTAYRTDDWYYYELSDGTKYKSPASPADEENAEEPSTLSGLFKLYKSAAIEEKDDKIVIREEMSDEIAEKRARKTTSFLFDVYEPALLDKDSYSLRLRGCTDTYTFDREGYLLQWTETVEFYFQLRVSLRENPPYLIVSDTVADYLNRGRPVEVVFPKDLQSYPAY
jgi:sulfur carrier protein ThiS